MDYGVGSVACGKSDASRKQFPLGVAMERLEKALTSAEESQNQLAGRLQAVRRPAPEKRETMDKPQDLDGGGSSLVCAMNSLAARLEGLAARTRVVLEDLEI